MSTDHEVRYSPVRQASRIILAVLILLGASATLAKAQTTAASPQSSEAMLSLPDSPEALSGEATASSSSNPGDGSFDPTPSSTPKHALHLQMVIAPGEIADPMSVHDKIVGGMKDSVSLFSALGWLGSAGWSQLTNGTPNYGTDAGAFGQRLGAATIRGVSEGVFSESLFAPLFHQDPRYYVMGPGHPFIKRLFYAGTRAIITRNDNGHLAPNFWLMAGNASGAALTIPYYPKINTTASQVALTFGGSLGGSAFGFVVDEFIVDALIDLHIKKKQ
jgi:hypothetical protein